MQLTPEDRTLFEKRPQLGEGVPADADSIGRGWQLVQRGVWLWLLILCVGDRKSVV